MNFSNLLRVLTWMFVFLCAFGLAAWFYVYHIYYSQLLDIPGEASEVYTLTIARGANLISVADALETARVIPAGWALIEYLKREDMETKVEAGVFRFASGGKIPEIAQRLLTGGSEQIKFTVLEGWNSADVDAKLAELGLSSLGEFSEFVRNPPSRFRVPEFAATRGVSSFEGYLFPDTYFIDRQNFSVAELVGRMLAEMEKKLITIGYSKDASAHSLHELLTLASIVELEEKREKNRPLVADVLWRRLDAGIALGADATLFYALGHKNNLTAADLATDSPYNTRKNRGLPPTPVAFPSLSSIRAALRPTANDAWYYLHDVTTGEIYFGRTLEEHNVNKVRYIK